MSNSAVLFDVREGIATITLNRPERLNALNTDMFEGMLNAFDRTDSDDSVRAVVVTGAGRAFCAGADLSAGAGTFDFETASPNGSSHRDPGGVLALRIYRSLKPVIAAINGPAIGIGATMTLPMDMRIISDTARVGFVFTRRGIVPDGAASWFLPRIVGIAQALDWCLSGRVFSAGEALNGGLVRSICENGKVLPTASKLASEIASNSAPVSVAITRHLLWRMLGADHPMVAHRIESRAIYYTGRMADSAEGIATFLEKRDPSWKLSPSKDMPEWLPWRDEPPFIQ
jgi:enoyl-CoA hydratase/carnithine racemase